MATSCLEFLVGRIQNSGDGAAELLPTRTLIGQLRSTLCGQAIDPHALFVLRGLPFGGDPLLSFQAVQCGIERAGVYSQNVTRLRLNSPADSIAVLRSP